MIAKENKMPNVTVRNLPVGVHNAIKARALSAGRSTEAEIRFILEQAVMPTPTHNLNAAFAKFRQQTGGVDLPEMRDKTPSEPVDFSK